MTKRLNILSLLVLCVSIIIFAQHIMRQSQIIDSEGPVISIDDELLEVSIHDSEDSFLKGVTATDKKDGDVTDSLVVESVSEFTEENTRIVNYAAFDSSNHVSKSFRRIKYTDYTPIKLTLEEPLRFAMSNNNINITENLTALDCLDGDITEKITLSADTSIMVDMASEYPVTIQVTNSVGDTEYLPVTVTIYDQAVENSAPKFTLTDYLIYTPLGVPVDPYDYVEYITCRNTQYLLTSGTGTYGVDTSDMDADQRKAFQEQDPAISQDYVEVINDVDYTTPGVYEIKYTMRDEEDNTGSVYLIVVVEEE